MQPLEPGEIVFSVVLWDDGGTALGGTDRSASVSLRVTVAPAPLAAWVYALLGVLLFIPNAVLVAWLIRCTRRMRKPGLAPDELEVRFGTTRTDTVPAFSLNDKHFATVEGDEVWVPLIRSDAQDQWTARRLEDLTRLQTVFPPFVAAAAVDSKRSPLSKALPADTFRRTLQRLREEGGAVKTPPLATIVSGVGLRPNGADSPPQLEGMFSRIRALSPTRFASVRRAAAKAKSPEAPTPSVALPRSPQAQPLVGRALPGSALRLKSAASSTVSLGDVGYTPLPPSPIAGTSALSPRTSHLMLMPRPSSLLTESDVSIPPDVSFASCRAPDVPLAKQPTMQVERTRLPALWPRMPPPSSLRSSVVAELDDLDARTVESDEEADLSLHTPLVGE
jgi:hypothetical protein